MAAVCAALLCLGAACERPGPEPEPDPEPIDEPLELEPMALICPPAIGPDVAGWGMLSLATPSCPPEVVMFGIGGNGCAIAASCDRICRADTSIQINDVWKPWQRIDLEYTNAGC